MTKHVTINTTGPYVRRLHVPGHAELVDARWGYWCWPTFGARRENHEMRLGLFAVGFARRVKQPYEEAE